MDCPSCANDNLDEQFKNWIILSENKTMERTIVENWFHGKTTIYGSLLTAWIVLVNIGICAVIFKKTRSPEHAVRGVNNTGRMTSWLAVSFSTVQLLIGVLIIPPRLFTDVHQSWPFGGLPCRFWLTAQVILVAATFWLLAALTLDRALVRISSDIYQRLTRGVSAPVLVVSLAWVFAVIAAIPLLASMEKEDFVLEEVCAVALSQDDAVVFLVLTFILPVSFILTGSGAILMAKPREVCIASMTSLDIEADDPQKPEVVDAGGFQAAILFIDFCSLVTWSPSFVVNTLVPFCHGMCVDPGLWSLLLWLGYTNAGLAPCLWVVSSTVRAKIRLSLKSLCCLCRRFTDPDAKVKVKESNNEQIYDELCARSVDAILLATDDGKHETPSIG